MQVIVMAGGAGERLQPLTRGRSKAAVPFGGFKMSGVGSKTGGPDYLLQFMIPRNVVENTFRRGYAAPEEEP